MLTKDHILAAFPVHDGDLVIRHWLRSDLDRRAAWPPYLHPYAELSSALSAMPTTKRDEYFRGRDGSSDGVTLSVDMAGVLCIAHISLRNVDWRAMTVNNMGFRVHPDWCNRGLGSRILRIMVARLAAIGIVSLRVDVSSANGRAIRCYEKSGFALSGQFDQEDGSFFWMTCNLLRGQQGSEPDGASRRRLP
jgi:RimJ/RimL family protein N-acetyltransferase